MFIEDCCCGIQFRDLFNIKLRSGRQSRLTPVRLFGPRSCKWKHSLEQKIGAKMPHDHESKKMPIEVNLSLIGFFNRMACNPFGIIRDMHRMGVWKNSLRWCSLRSGPSHIFDLVNIYGRAYMDCICSSCWHFLFLFFKCHVVEVTNTI